LPYLFYLDLDLLFFFFLLPFLLLLETFLLQFLNYHILVK
jgi:hypothetical protein